MSRSATIRTLLERHTELAHPASAGNGGDQTFGSMPIQNHYPNCAIHHDKIPDHWHGVRCTCALRCWIEIDRMRRTMREDRQQPLIIIRAEVKASVRELGWHLTERFYKCTYATRTVEFRGERPTGLATNQAVVARPGGWTFSIAEHRHKRGRTPLQARVLVVTWDRGVKPDRVDAGVSWLADNWTARFEPELPVEVLEAA